MLDYAIQRYLSHILLVDSESPGAMRGLVQNAFELHAAFGEVSGVSPYGHYTLILAFPSSRGDLAHTASELAEQGKRAGAKCRVNAIPDSDMFMTKGKAGLLSCSLFSLAGAVLMNDSPIRLDAAADILSLTNERRGIHLVSEGMHAAIVSSQSDINQRILRLPDGHDLEQILRAMGARHRRQSSSRGHHRNWWRFWE